ncbi:tetratricopeptide repeat protein [candidate division KSB1 bacterium]|nr:tetratricopeptide repeat protein [candidate division KSB1 bacterium]
MRNLKTTILLLSILFFSDGQKSCFAQKDGEDIVIGKYRVLHSDVLNEDRLFFVHLPQEYQETRLAYPVLYILYAQLYNYFADATIITEKLGSTGEMPPMIIVGVANTNRYRDLLPISTRDRQEGGGAANFLSFLETELIPYIDQTYRTKNYRILAGPQAAAVFSLYALLERPKLFNAIISENPFMNPENAEYLFPRAEQFFKNTESLKHFLYVNCEQNERRGDLEYAEKLARLLETAKPDGFQFKVNFREPSGYFVPPLPFTEALRGLFSTYKLPEQFQANSLQELLDYYQKRSEEYGFTVDPPDLMLTFQGDKLNQQRKTTQAIELFEYQLKLYPKSLNGLLRLGETYRGLGEYEKARDFYMKFLAIRDVDAAMIHRRLSQVNKMIDSSAVYRIEQEIKQNGIRAGLKKYKLMNSDPQNKLYFNENEFNSLGYRLMGSGKIKDAIEIFKINAEHYPQSANVYDSLGEAYLKSGDTKKAIQNYQKSLKLNPENNSAKEMLKKLDNK